MRIALFGQAAFGRGVLEALLAAGEEVVGVSTPSARPDPLFEAASQDGIPVIDTPDLRDDEAFQRFAAWQAELLIYAFVTDEVERRVRDAAAHGAIQFHPALLPAHRGSTAMNWTILAGDTRTGVTIFWVDDGVDSGPILLQREVEVGPNDSVGTLYYERLTPIGIEAIVEAVRLISTGTAPREPQDPTQASLEPPCSADHARIDWMQHGHVVGNVIRGCDPQPGALASLRGESLRLYEAEYRPGAHGDLPGTVVAAIDTRVEVAVIGGTIVIGRVQREGQPRIAAAEVVRPGDILERAPVIIGCVREQKLEEHRVALLPEGVSDLARAGHTVLVETKAGEGSHYLDEDYAAAGATIIATPEEVYERAALVVEVKEPQPSEYRLMREGQVIFTYLHLAAEPHAAQAIIDSKCIAIAYETVRAADGSLPLLMPMSEVAGRMAVEIGAHFLKHPGPGRGLLLGGVSGVPPAHCLVIGSGNVGSNAVRIAVGLGARVTVTSIATDQLRAIDRQYAGRVETVYATQGAIAEAVRSADLLIGAILVEGRRAPTVVTREMVRTMPRGAVIVDVAVDQGGCIETTRPTNHREPIYVEEGVVHYAVPNMPGAVPRTSSRALASLTLPYILRIAAQGVEAAVRADPALAHGVNAWRGQITHPAVAEALGVPYVPLDQAMVDRA